jgi:hypothetical protein
MELVSADRISQHGYPPRESGASGDVADGGGPTEELEPADAMSARQGRAWGGQIWAIISARLA